MKLLRSAMLVTVIAATGLVSGCSKQLGNVGSGALTDTLNAVSDMSMPVKINDTFSVTKITKLSGDKVSINLDLAKNATGSIDKYINKELQGQLADGVICRLPELKAGGTAVTLNIYQNGVFKKTINKSASYLCN